MFSAKLTFLFVLLFGISSCSSISNKSSSTTFPYDGGQVKLLHHGDSCFIYIDGDINPGLKRAFSDAKNNLARQSCNEKMVMIKSHGGDLKTAMDIGRQIRWGKLNTDMHGYCESACVFIYIGGTQRYVHLNSQVVENSQLGVHQPASELLFHQCIPKTPQSGPIVQEISQYLHLMLTDKAAHQLSEWMFTTSCQKIAYIDAASMIEAGIATTKIDFH